MGLFDGNTADIPKSKTEEERLNVIRLGSQLNVSLKNPCLKEQNLSYKCLGENVDKSLCEKYFVNYDVCRKFWSEVQKDRKQRGITPALPPVDEREQYKAEYLKNRNK